jgi:hypothetical protein
MPEWYKTIQRKRSMQGIIKIKDKGQGETSMKIVGSIYQRKVNCKEEIIMNRGKK